MVANHTHVTAVISTQATTGQCNLIGGVMSNSGSTVLDGLQGTYCPDSGVIIFRRMHPVQHYLSSLYREFEQDLVDINTIQWTGTFNELKIYQILVGIRFMV